MQRGAMRASSSEYQWMTSTECTVARDSRFAGHAAFSGNLERRYDNPRFHLYFLFLFRCRALMNEGGIRISSEAFGIAFHSSGRASRKVKAFTT